MMIDSFRAQMCLVFVSNFMKIPCCRNGSYVSSWFQLLTVVLYLLTTVMVYRDLAIWIITVGMIRDKTWYEFTPGMNTLIWEVTDSKVTRAYRYGCNRKCLPQFLRYGTVHYGKSKILLHLLLVRTRVTCAGDLFSVRLATHTQCVISFLRLLLVGRADKISSCVWRCLYQQNKGFLICSEKILSKSV